MPPPYRISLQCIGAVFLQLSVTLLFPPGKTPGLHYTALHTTHYKLHTEQCTLYSTLHSTLHGKLQTVQTPGSFLQAQAMRRRRMQEKAAVV